MIEDHGRTQLRRRNLKPHVVQRDSPRVASVEPVSWHRPKHEIFTGNLRKASSRSVLRSTTSAKRQMDVVKSDILNNRSPNRAQRNARTSLPRVVVARESCITKLRRISRDRAVNIAE